MTARIGFASNGDLIDKSFLRASARSIGWSGMCGCVGDDSFRGNLKVKQLIKKVGEQERNSQSLICVRLGINVSKMTFYPHAVSVSL